MRAGAPVDELDSELTAPLLRAARKNHARVVRVLINHGAVATARGNSMLQCLACVCRFLLLRIRVLGFG